MLTVDLKKLHEVQLENGFMDIEVAGQMRRDVKTIRRMCGRDHGRGKAYKNAFDSFLEFCEVIGADPVKTFERMLVKDKS
ncbi:MAG: hypothetical protein AAF609_14915 [Cyanobacteria bacterium P01_C01_bin.120]